MSEPTFSLESEHNGVSKHQRPRRIYVLTSPRTASNLFIRMLNLEEQDRLKIASSDGGYFFFPAFMAHNSMKIWHKHVQDLTESERATIKEVYQKCAKNYDDFLTAADQEGKIAFVKEHVNVITEPTSHSRYLANEDTPTEPPWTVHLSQSSDPTHSPTNPTYIPDDLLKTFLPTFLIRHPIQTVPSMWRAENGPTLDPKESTLSDQSKSQIASHRLACSLRFMRILYDWYVEYFTSLSSTATTTVAAAAAVETSTHSDSKTRQPQFPLIIDASDLLTNPQKITTKFCHLTGLDATKLRFTWDTISPQARAKSGNEQFQRFLSTLHDSTSVIAEKAEGRTLDLDCEVGKWEGEFGTEVAGKMRELVEMILPDYEYLFERRMRF